MIPKTAMLTTRWLFLGLVLACAARTEPNRPVPLSDRQREILFSVAQSAGNLTAERHEEFWRPFQQDDGDLERLRSRAELLKRRDLFLLAQSYQLEAWRCAETSFNAREVKRSRHLDDLERQAFEVVKGSAAGREKFERSVQNTRELLRAAAARSVVKANDGSEIQLDLQLIREMSEPLNDLFERVNRLLDPVWRER